MAVVGGVVLTLAGCGTPTATPEPAADDWGSVLADARGQSVRWGLPGSDAGLVAVLEREVTPRLAALGVRLELAARSEPDLDALSLRSRDVATGLGEEGWHCDWAQRLPNADLVDTRSPQLRVDLGAEQPGCTSPWRQAHATLVHDIDALDPDDAESIEALLAWAGREPGRFTYPAPPDPTGMLALRTILDDTIGGPGELVREVDEASDQYAGAARRLWERLDAVAPGLWRGGAAYPPSARDVERLYARGEIDAYLTLNPERVAPRVADGTYRASTRQSVPAPGNLGDPSWLVVPGDEQAPGAQAGALVLADVLLEPEVQLALWREAGVAPAIDPARTEPAVRPSLVAAFGTPPDPGGLSLAELTRHPRPELAQVYVRGLEGTWADEVPRSAG